MIQPIKYFGGKGMMVNKIVENFPKEGTYNTYIEPFGGAFSVGLNKPTIEPIEIYNDLEKNVYSLYKVLSDSKMFNNLKYKLDLVGFNEDLRSECRENLKKEDLSIEDRAFNFFYLNRTSRNGIGGIMINRLIRRGICRSVNDLLSTIDKLPEFHQRLSNVMVLNRDGCEIIKENNGENVFIYCDPPYDWSTRTSTRYKVDMNGAQQDEFLNLCINSKSKILISGYDCERYNILESNGFTKLAFNVKTVDGKNNGKEKTESLWKNY